MNQDPQTIVIVPSINVDAGLSSVRQQALEERFLFLLLLLRQPRARVIYVTSQQIHPDVLDYYLDLLPGVFAGHARKRLFAISPLDGSAQPLTKKLLDRPRLLQHIRSLILDPNRAHLVPYNTTEQERELAIALGIPMYGADPKTFYLGTKSGARKVFGEEGVSYPLGIEDLHSADDLVNAIITMRKQKPTIKKVVAKLNEGVSGLGNANIDLSAAPPPGDPAEKDGVLECVKAMKFESPKMTWDRYSKKLSETGGIVEELITGRDFRSPSAQLRVTPLGEVEALSTHDQMLGGPSGQAYLGCKFPASPEYGPAIMREALKVGRRLAKEGVIGRFALDFVAVMNDQQPVGGLRDRDQPEKRGYDPSISHAAIPHGRRLQPGNRCVHDASRRTQVVHRQRSRALACLPLVYAHRSLRHRGEARTSFRSLAPERDRLSHGERCGRTRGTRVHCRGEYARRSRGSVQQDGRSAGH